jgi:hypothetical protein
LAPVTLKLRDRDGIVTKEGLIRLLASSERVYLRRRIRLRRHLSVERSVCVEEWCR